MSRSFISVEPLRFAVETATVGLAAQLGELSVGDDGGLVGVDVVHDDSFGEG